MQATPQQAALIKKYDLKMRRVLLDPAKGISFDPFATLNEAQIVAKAKETISLMNEELGEGEQLDLTIRGAIKLHKGGVLLDMGSEGEAKLVVSYRRQFEAKFGSTIQVRPKEFAVIIQYVPTSYNITSKANVTAIEENSGLEEGSISSIRWFKNPTHMKAG